MNTQIQTKVKTPVMDFRSMLSLDETDTLNGYELCLSGFRVQLEDIEKAYMAADAKGLVGGTLVQFAYGSLQLGVVTGRNLMVTNNFLTPVRYPIMVHSTRGYYEYSDECAVALSEPVHAVALLKNGDYLEGVVTGVKVDENKYGHVEIEGRLISMREFAVLEIATVKH